MFIEALFDPSFLFCLGCILTPLWVARDTLTQADAIEYFTERSMCFSLLLIPFCWIIGKLLRYHQRTVLRQRKHSGKDHYAESALAPLTFGERSRARWYLLNGVVIHILMDGCVGVFKTSRLFAENYAKLDRRYGDPLGSFNGATVHVVSLVELFVKGPVCILLYWAFQTRHPARDALEFFTCVTQAYGTIVYLGQEAVSGALNLDVDYALTFSSHFMLYFWFAIFFGCALYLVLPSILGLLSFRRLIRQSRAYMTAHPPPAPRAAKQRGKADRQSKGSDSARASPAKKKKHTA